MDHGNSASSRGVGAFGMFLLTSVTAACLDSLLPFFPGHYALAFTLTHVDLMLGTCI